MTERLTTRAWHWGQDEDFQPFDYGLLLDKARKGQYPQALAALTATEEQLKASSSLKPQQASAQPASTAPTSKTAASTGQSQQDNAIVSSSTLGGSPDVATASISTNSGAPPTAPDPGKLPGTSAAEASKTETDDSSRTEDPSGGSPAAGKEAADEEWKHWRLDAAAVRDGLLHRLRYRRALMQVDCTRSWLWASFTKDIWTLCA